MVCVQQTRKGRANDGIAIKNVIFAGMWKNFYEDEKVSENFFNRAGNNTVLENTRQIIAKDGDYSSVVADAVKVLTFLNWPIASSKGNLQRCFRRNKRLDGRLDKLGSAEYCVLILQ